jgi:6-phosphofructokinase
MEHAAMRSGKLVIAEGGGPTAVINQSLAGAVLEARLFPQIERIYGARYGVRGIVNEDFIDLSAETRANLEAVAATPSSALGSTRDKPDLAYCRNILAAWQPPEPKLRHDPPEQGSATTTTCCRLHFD